MNEEEFLEELAEAIEESDYNPIESVLCGPGRNTYYDPEEK